MSHKLLTAVLCAVFSLAFTADAQATFLTSNGDIDAADPIPAPIVGPPLPDIKTIHGGGGNVYTNTIDSDASGGLTIGDEVRSVSFEVLASALNGFNSPMVTPAGTSFVAVGAINGTIVGFAPNTAPIVAFTSGRLFLTDDPLGAFDPEDPSSVEAPSAVFAEYTLTSPQSVIATASGAAVSLPSGLTQLSTPDAFNLYLSQGVLIFQEDSTPAQNGGVPGTPGGGVGGDDWLISVDDVSPPGLFKTDEGLVVVVDQTVESVFLGGGLALDATDLAALDAYALEGFGSVFATGFGGASSSNFDPFGGMVFTGDFRGHFSSESHVGHQVVPEPSSLMLLGIGVAALGVVGFRRRRNKKPQAA